MIRKVVLPAAGHGTRLQPLTRFIPKEMLPVGDRLVLHHVLAECRAAGLDCLLAIVSRAKGALVEALETLAAEEAGDAFYPQVYYVYQRVQGGLGHAILHAEAFAGGEPIAVALADTIIMPVPGARCPVPGSEGRDCRTPGVPSQSPPGTGHRAPGTAAEPLLARLAAAHEALGAVATIAVEPVPMSLVSRYGIVRPAGEVAAGEPFRILDLVEKPAPEAAPSRLAIAARYVLSPEIFPALRATGRGTGGEFQLTDALAALARAGHTVAGVCLAPGERRLDIGNHESYGEAWQLLGAKQP